MDHSDASPDLVGWHEARRIAHSAATALPAELVPLDAASGRTLASDVVALCEIPHYASSAMDGWAVAGPPPWRLVTTGPLRAGEAVAIVTGGLMPVGATAVLRSESGVTSTNGHPELVPAEDAESGEWCPSRHIRPAGEEAHAQDTVFSAGELLTPAHVAVAAACGHDALRVVPLPRVSLLLTGDEVIERGIPAPGQVRDSFGPTLGAFVAALGGIAVARRRVPDTLDAMLAALSPNDQTQAGAEVLITTGSTGRSSADHLRNALDRVGARILITGVAMRPGAPALLAQLPDGRFLVGLPGNPLAAMMSMLTLTGPLLAGLRDAEDHPLGRAIVSGTLPGRPGRTTLIPHRLVDGRAIPTGWHGAGMLRGLAESDGVLICPPDGAADGAELESLPLPWAHSSRR